MPADAPLPRPVNSIGGGLQHERTSLAWERTAIAMMVAGVILARYGAQSIHYTLGFVGVAQTAAGGVLLAWAGRHDQDLHSPTRPASAVPQVGLTRLIGLVTIVFCASSFTLAVLLV
jgi:uncharacterized membrane protein YidH (DUF202 family)